MTHPWTVHLKEFYKNLTLDQVLNPALLLLSMTGRLAVMFWIAYSKDTDDVGTYGITLSCVIIIGLIVDFERSTVGSRKVALKGTAVLIPEFSEYLSYYTKVILFCFALGVLGGVSSSNYMIIPLVAALEVFIGGVRKFLISLGMFRQSMLIDLLRSSGWIPILFLYSLINKEWGISHLIFIWSMHHLMCVIVISYIFISRYDNLFNFKKYLKLNISYLPIKNIYLIVASLNLILIEVQPRFFLKLFNHNNDLALYVMFGSLIFPITTFLWVILVGPRYSSLGSCHENFKNSVISRSKIAKTYLNIYFKSIIYYMIISVSSIIFSISIFFIFLDQVYLSNIVAYFLLIFFPMASFASMLLSIFLQLELMDRVNFIISVVSNFVLFLTLFFLEIFKISDFIALEHIVGILYFVVILDVLMRLLFVYFYFGFNTSENIRISEND